MYIIGIDPGKTGGVCVLRKDLSLVALEPLRAPIDNALFFRHLLENQQAHIFCEKVGAWPGQGVVSVFTFGFGVGAIYGACVSIANASWNWVQPKEWQKAFGIAAKTKIRKGASKQERARLRTLRRKELKQASLQRAKELYPDAAHLIGDKDGLSDAVLIARYGALSLTKN